MKPRSILSTLIPALVTTLGSSCSTPSAHQPTLSEEFRSSSGRTVIQYYTYDSGPCGTGSNCDFRDILKVPAGFDQVEVFLSGFKIQSATSTDKISRVASRVQKYRYDANTGDLELGVNAQLATDSAQPYSYQTTFAVILTDAGAAIFTQVGGGCRDIAKCNITGTYPGAVPPGMQFIGLGTRMFDLGSDSGPLAINTLSAHINSLNITSLPDVQLDFLCSLQDASGANVMFSEWDASIIAFDPAEMERNNSPMFPQFSFLGHGVSVRQDITNHVQTPTATPITGFLDAFEGLSLFYAAGQEHDIWMIESSALNFSINPPNTAITKYGIFLGTRFGDTQNAQTYSFQESRAVGLLR